MTPIDFAEVQTPDAITTAQRRALYRILFRDADHLKDIIRCLSKDDAFEVIRIFVRAESNQVPIPESD